MYALADLLEGAAEDLGVQLLEEDEQLDLDLRLLAGVATFDLLQ